MPWLSMRIVPSELEAVFTTTALEELLLVCAAGCVLAAELVVLLDELLPQAAIRSDAAIAGMDSFSRWRMCSLLCKSGTVLARVGAAVLIKTPCRRVPSAPSPTGNVHRVLVAELLDR